MGRKIRILFVEDDLSNKFLLEMTLKNSSHSFQVSGDGNDALQKIKENDFDIVFLDIQLPDMNGYEVAQKIRSLEDPLKKNIPIISMSANEPYGEEIKLKLKAAGISGYINKPFTEQEIDEKILESLNYSEEEKQIHFFSANNNLASGIDMERLMRVSKGDPDLIRNMINILIRQKDESFSKFNSALVLKDWKAIENTAHSLKSSIIFFGMGFLFDTMDKIERLAFEKNSLEEIPGLIHVAQSEIDKSVEELNKTFASL